MINFKEFLTAIAIFNNRIQNSEELKFKFLFKVYDSDSDGLIGREELYNVLKMLISDNLTIADLQ